MAPFNIRTLNAINQKPELNASAAQQKIEIIYIHEYKHYNRELEIKYHGFQ